MKHLKYIALLLFFPLAGIAQTPQELKSWLPEIPGWTISEEIEVFDSENLFNRINGAAPLFLENNFREMTSMEYTKENAYITIQAYRHASPEDAFGMYASERSSGLTFFSAIGGEAQGDTQSLYFFSGSIYVKMMANQSSGAMEESMRDIGKGLAAKIDPDASYPAIFQKFPVEGKIPYSETYTTSSFIGHEFLKRVYSCKYEKDSEKFQLFIVDGQTAEGAHEILNQYFTFTKQKDNFTEGKLKIEDRYNGTIPCIWKGRYIIGIFSESGEDTGEDALIEEISSAI